MRICPQTGYIAEIEDCKICAYGVVTTGDIECNYVEIKEKMS